MKIQSSDSGKGLRKIIEGIKIIYRDFDTRIELTGQETLQRFDEMEERIEELEESS